MATRSPIPRRLRLLLPLVLLLLLVFLATTDHAAIWPLRNTLAYRLTRWWETSMGVSQPAGAAVLRGCVRGAADKPLPGATVLLSERDGTVHLAAADASGCYQPRRRTSRALCADRQRAWLHRAGDSAWSPPLRLGDGQQRTLDIALSPASLPALRPGAGRHQRPNHAHMGAAKKPT